MEQMTDFQVFIKTNKLKQKQVAEYLETSPQYINQVAKGLCDLSDEKYEKLVQGGWDVSMLNIPPYIKVPSTLTVFNPSSDEHKEIGDGVDMSVVPAKVVEEIKAEVAEEIKAEIIEEIREEIKEEIKQEEAITVIPVEIANQVDVDIKKYIEENESELEKLTPSDLTGDVDGVEKIRKDSMSPTFVPGDRVFIKFLKHKSHIIDGTIYYFNLRNRPTMIRQVKIEGDKLRLIAFNSQYSDIITDFDNVLRVAEVNGMYRSFFTNQYSEAESVRRKKDEQIDNLIQEVGKAGYRVDKMMEQMTMLYQHAMNKKN